VTNSGRRTLAVVTEETNVTSATKRAPLHVPRGAHRAGSFSRPRPRPRPLPGWALAASPAITLAVMLWGVGARPYWGDEADTISAVSRSLPQLFRLLGHIDAVHGLYYLLLWPVARIAGTGEFVTRLPSAVAMAAAAAGITAIAGRLGSRRAGLWAGLMFAALPAVTLQGHDARPYAAVTAAAVLASYLLVRAAEDPRPRWLTAYGLSLVGVGYMQMFGLLLLPAHAVTLIGLSRRRFAAGGGAPRALVLRRWLVTAGASVVAVLPIAILGWVQRGQIAWIPRTGWSDAGSLVQMLTAGSVSAAIVIGLLCLLGTFRAGGVGAGGVEGGGVGDGGIRGPAAEVDGGADRGIAWLALPWLVLPPFILLAASLIMPVYFTRYLTYCLPAVALLAGAGLAAIGWGSMGWGWAGWPRRAGAAVALGALALVVALVGPVQLAMRARGGGMQTVSQFLSANERPGDAIVYPEALIPPWYLAYPEGFSRLRDLSMAQSPAAAGRLFGPGVPRAVLYRREDGVRRFWIVPDAGRSPAGYIAPGFRLAREWKLRGYQVVLLYTKTG
jgi:mannosyltransferase